MRTASTTLALARLSRMAALVKAPVDNALREESVGFCTERMGPILLAYSSIVIWAIR